MVSTKEAIECIDVILAYNGPDETGEDEMNWNIVNQAMNNLRLFAKEYSSKNGKDIFQMSLPEIKNMIQI